MAAHGSLAGLAGFLTLFGLDDAPGTSRIIVASSCSSRRRLRAGLLFPYLHPTRQRVSDLLTMTYVVRSDHVGIPLGIRRQPA